MAAVAEPPALPDPLAGDDEIQYLFIDENPFAKKKERPVGSVGPFPMRTGYDKLNYGTGMAYVLGLTAGGSYGVMRGLQIAPGKSYKIRMNSVMNTATRYGPWAANSLGILTGVRPALVAGGLMAGASTAACYFLSNDSANTNLNAPAKPGKH
ncbi:Mitochondrial import inner membrane translocase subunit tim23 [Irineochytrium annulatum]|nr:Mitochondrial import inner membrane translocase subunit tim23 [Irineochytrium annulatum]